MMLLVETVVSNAKFHSSQGKINQSTVVTVSRNINHKTEEALAEDLAVEEALAEDLAVEEALAEEVDLTEDHEKCTKQLVEIVVRIVKCHSSQDRTNQYTAMNVFKIMGTENRIT
jgi:hypothetical protein